MNRIKKIIPQSGECHFLIDAGAFLIPYLKYNLVLWNRINITPFTKMLELYFNLSVTNPLLKFYVFIDNGIPNNMSLVYSKYKKNRNHSIHRREDAIVSPKQFSNPYSVNRTLIQSVFTDLGNGVYFFSEADYQLGYVLHKLHDMGVESSRCFILTHDNDIVSLLEYANVFHRTKKDNTVHINYYPFGKYDYVISNLRVETYEEYIIMKALLGDKMDNVMPPMLITKRFVTSLFNRYKHEYGFMTLTREATEKIIRERGLNKYKDSSQFDAFINKVLTEFNRNYKIFDIYNCEWLFSQFDRRYIDTVLNAQIKNMIVLNGDRVKNTLRLVSSTYYDLFLKWIDIMQKKNKYVVSAR